MAFNVQFWGKVTSSMNTEFIVQPDGTHLSEGCRNLFSYQSLTDTFADLLGAGYFAHETVLYEVCQGDWIYAVARDFVGPLIVMSVNSLAKTITVAYGQTTGNIRNVDTVTVPPDGAGLEFTGADPFSIRVSAPRMRLPALDLRNALNEWMDKASPETKERLAKKLKDTNPRTMITGLEAIEFRALSAYIQLSDGLDAFGILGLFMDELSAKRTLLITDGASFPTSTDAALEINTTKGTFLPPRLTTTQRNALTNPIPGMQFYNSTINAPQIYTQGLLANSWKTYAFEQPVFYFSFSIFGGGTGQTIPFDGPEYTNFALNPSNYYSYSIYNPNSFLIDNPGADGNQTITLPTSPDFNRAFWEVQAQIVVDMGTLPTSGGNWGQLSIATGWPTAVANYYIDNFHPGSGSSSGSTFYTANVKGVFVQTGSSNPTDNLMLSFPIKNLGGPGNWTIRNGCISIKRVGVEF